MTAKAHNKPGDTYNWWTLVEYVSPAPSKEGGDVWRVRCRCGDIYEKPVNQIKRGRPVSCRKCWFKHRRPKHKIKRADPHHKTYTPGISTWVEAVCPRCGVKHPVWIAYIGRGTLRKFCPDCKLLTCQSMDHPTPEAIYAMPGGYRGGCRRVAI